MSRKHHSTGKTPSTIPPKSEHVVTRDTSGALHCDCSTFDINVKLFGVGECNHTRAVELASKAGGARQSAPLLSPDMPRLVPMTEPELQAQAREMLDAWQRGEWGAGSLQNVIGFVDYLRQQLQITETFAASLPC